MQCLFSGNRGVELSAVIALRVLRVLHRLTAVLYILTEAKGIRSNITFMG